MGCPSGIEPPSLGSQPGALTIMLRTQCALVLLGHNDDQGLKVGQEFQPAKSALQHPFFFADIVRTAVLLAEFDPACAASLFAVVLGLTSVGAWTPDVLQFGDILHRLSPPSINF